MKRAARVAAAALVSLAACVDASNVPADADVEIRGTFARQNGTPAAGVAVALYREADVGEGLAAFTTLGLTCAADKRKLSACSHGDDTQTDGKGGFRYTLKGSDTHGFLGNAATLELTAALSRATGELSGPATTVRFQVQTTALAFPLRFWEPELSAAVEGRVVRVGWGRPPQDVAPPEVPLSGLRPSATFELPGGAAVWTVSSNGSEARIDPRVLEDSEGALSVTLQQRAVRVPDSLGREIDVLLRSPQRPYAGPAGPPASRGAPCSTAADGAAPVGRAPCWLTDGTFADAFACPGTPCPGGSVAAAIVDLGESRPVSLAVVRGCAGCTVDVSPDAASWRTIAVASGDAADFTVAPPGSPRARYVRVRSASGVASLREVSVWDRFPSIPGGSIFGTAPVAPPARRVVEPVGGSVPVLLALVTAALAAGLLGGYALRRRKG